MTEKTEGICPNSECISGYIKPTGANSKGLSGFACPTCEGTGKAQPAKVDRDEIRSITHPGCTYHSTPECPIDGNHSCMYCEQMTDQIIALIEGGD